MKKALVLLTILLLPSLIYLFFALGTPRVKRAPFFGPREAVTTTDSLGNTKTDTSYFTIPAFRLQTTEGRVFDSQRLNGKLYIACFANVDTIRRKFIEFARDYKINRSSYALSRFVFFYPTDSVDATTLDVGKELGIGADTAYMVYAPQHVIDSLRDNFYFVKDPARKTDPWFSKTDFILVDRRNRIRGYYDPRLVIRLKEMKEDMGHITFRDEGVETVKGMEVEQKRKK
ncbi:MAG: hypothetical protein ACRCYO_07800 [Bacteroidia bacterium]